MSTQPTPPDEADRLAALLSCGVIDTEPEAVFDDLVALAARLLDVPTAVVNLVATDRQWAKAAVGMSHGDEAPRKASLCAEAILTPHEVMVVPDAARDPRFAGNQFVEDGLRFYAGVPLVTGDGYAVGTLCVADVVPRQPSQSDLAALRTLGSAAAAQLDLRRRAKASARIANERLAILALAPDAFVSILPDGTITEWNRQAEQLFGWPREQALGQDVTSFVAADQLRAAQHAVGPVEVTMPCHDGTSLDVELSLAAVELDGQLHYNAFMRDVRERKLAEREREQDLAGLRSVALLQQRLARGTDEPGLWRELCATATAQAGADAAVLWLAEPDGGGLAVADHNRDLEGMSLPLDRSSVIAEVLATGAPAFVADLAADGRANPELVRRGAASSAAFVPVTVDGRSAGVLCVLYETPRPGLSERETELLSLICGEAAVAIERAGLMARLQYLAHHDELTGAVNRRVLDGDLTREMSRARRSGERLAVAMLDLDHFKAFNDLHGHQAGDELLRGAVCEWRTALRPTDTLARYGGEEFVLVLPDCNAGDALTLVDRLGQIVPSEQTVSAGIAEWDGVEDAEALLRRADTALYAAKERGRNRACLAEDATAPAR